MTASAKLRSSAALVAADATEEWRPTHVSPHYEVSSLGRIRSLRRTLAYDDGTVRTYREKVLKPTPDAKGYATVRLRVDGRSLSFTVHALVARAFIGPCPEGMVVCHFDGDPSRNALSNLGYTTGTENQLDRSYHKKHGKGRERPGARERAVTVPCGVRAGASLPLKTAGVTA